MKITTANGVLLALPQVVGFTTNPRLAEPSAPHLPLAGAATTSSCCENLLRPHRHSRGTPQLIQLTAATRIGGEDSLCTTRQSSSLLINLNGTTRDNSRIRQPWWVTRVAAATTSTMTSEAAAGSITGAAARGRSMDDGGLRLAIIGVGADEVGVMMRGRFGSTVISMDELMKGRRGRRTETVKAKAVSNWLTEEGSADRILTGFPTTVAEAEALEKFGVKFADLVVLVPDVGCSEVMESIMELYEGKVTKVSYEKDVATMCTSAVSLLGFDAPRSATNVEDNSAARVAAAPSFGFIHMEGEQVNRSHGAQGENTVAIDKITGAKNASADEELSAAPDERDEVTTMSPSEHILAKKRGTAAHDEVIQAAKRGAELKRAQKQAIREKKRAANEAQRLDTPFYVAVASGKPKARYHAPVPIVPSRITERLSSAVADDDTNVNTQLEFGPLVIDSPASDCLLAAGIRQPTGIQMEGMGAIADGESVILHAMTGSGKTLAFLLPLMQRWTPSLFDTKGGRSAATAVAAVNGARSDGAFRVLLALPTRELAIQVAREAVLLAGGVTAYVELLVESGVHHDLGKVTAPIVVGSAKVLERIIRKSRPTVRNDVLSRIECIVVDEVDRLVDVLPKHTPPREVEKRKKHARPIAALLGKVVEAKPDVQVVACSATIGRPLRRELTNIVRSAAATDATVDRLNDDGTTRYDPRVIRDPFATSSDDDLSSERAVSIPESIRHYCVPLPDGDFFSRLEALTAAVRELQPRRPLVFVPPEERVTAVVAHLRRAGGNVGRNAMALHEAMGFGSGSDEDEEGGGGSVGGVRGKHSSEAILQHDKLTGQFRGVGRGSSPSRNPGAGENDLLLGGMGLGRLAEGETGAILVTGEDSARGLHFDDVDFVFLMHKPKNPDEYVHLAGRTGRQGKEGNVVTLVSVEEFRKMRSWSSSLKVYFENMNIFARQQEAGQGWRERAGNRADSK